MTGDVPGQGGNFLEQLLGDLLQLMGSGGGGDRQELARTLAVSVATGGTAEPNVDPVDRIRLEELVRVAELHVTEITGLSPSGSGAPLAVEAVAPGAWAARTVTDWRFVLEVMTASAPDEQALRGLVPEGDEAGGAAEIMARFMGTMGPMLAAMQLGSAIGHLARTTLGQYELPIPRPSSGLLLVPANATRFAEDWSLPPDDVRLWVSLREVTMHAVLGRPHVADRLRALLQDVVRGMAGE
ncbi:MAG TPA: zinc-dependent metalloprotease, partial [Acidimicrobiales bacterium]|nr:zinc-dependent metalloprotease [Acidimicrobiales bacterium]